MWVNEWWREKERAKEEDRETEREFVGKWIELMWRADWKETIFHVFKAANVWYLSELWWVLAAFYTHWSFTYIYRLHWAILLERYFGSCTHVSRAIADISTWLDSTRSLDSIQTNKYIHSDWHRDRENKESVSDERQELEMSKQWLFHCHKRVHVRISTQKCSLFRG